MLQTSTVTESTLELLKQLQAEAQLATTRQEVEELGFVYTRIGER